MKSRNVYTMLYSVTGWMVKLGYLNVLWLFFTVLGLGVFGLFPATFSVYAITRKWLNGETEINLFQNFKRHYFKEFTKTNSIGLIFTLLISIFIINILFYMGFQYDISKILMSLFGLLLMVTIILILLLLPLFASVELELSDYFRSTIYMLITHPFQALVLLIFTPLYVLILFTLPFLIPFFSVSIFSVVSTWLVRNSLTSLMIKISQ